MSWIAGGFFLSLFGIIVVLSLLRIRRAVRERSLRERGLEGIAQISEVIRGTYTKNSKAQRIVLRLWVSVPAPHGASAPYEASYGHTLLNAPALDKLVPGILVPVRVDPTDSSHLTIPWDQSGLGIEHES